MSRRMPGKPWEHWAERLSDLNNIVAGARDRYAPDVPIVSPNFIGRYAYFGTGPTGWETNGTAFNALTNSHTCVDFYGWHQALGSGLPGDEPDHAFTDRMGQTTLSYPDTFRKLRGWWGESAKPFFMTENHWLGLSALGFASSDYYGSTGTAAWRQAAQLAVKDVIICKAFNTQALLVHQIAQNINPPGKPFDYSMYYGWDYGNRGPVYKLTAALMACYWLEGATPLVCTNLSSTANRACWVFTFREGRGNLASWVFSGSDESTNLNVSGYARYDIWGRSVNGTTVTAEPTRWVPTDPKASAPWQRAGGG